nr:MAG TPA: hypothetical protein [Caudoviricetes sp.]
MCSAYKGRFMVHLARTRAQLAIISANLFLSPEGCLIFPLHFVTQSAPLM